MVRKGDMQAVCPYVACCAAAWQGIPGVLLAALVVQGRRG